MTRTSVTPDAARERFLAMLVALDDEQGGCWEWLGTRQKNGYGRVAVGGNRSGFAHRVSYAMFVGEIRAGYTIDHLCRNRGCVRPDHLEAVTQQENSRRMRAAQGYDGQTCGKGHVGQLYRGPSGSGYCKECRRLDRESKHKGRHKTHCKRGHDLAIHGKELAGQAGRRRCRQCDRDRLAGLHA